MFKIEGAVYSKIVGKALGFLAGILLFITILYFIFRNFWLSRFNLLYPNALLIGIIIYVILILAKFLQKNDRKVFF